MRRCLQPAKPRVYYSLANLRGGDAHIVGGDAHIVRIASHMPESPPPAHQEALGSPSAGSALGYFHAVVLRTPALTATSNEPLSVRRVSTAGSVALGQCSCPADICSSSFSPHQVELTLLCPRTMVKSPSFLFWMKRGSEESSGLREEEQAVRGTSFRVSAHSLGLGVGGKRPLRTHPVAPFASALFPTCRSSRGPDRHSFRPRCSRHVK